MSSRHLLLFAKTFFAVRQKVSKNGFTCKSAPELWSAAEADQGRCRTPRTPSPPWSSWLRFGSNLFQSKCRFTKSTMFHWHLKKTHSLTGNFFVYPFCFPVEWELERMRAAEAKGFSIRSRSTNFSLYFCFSFFASDLFPPKFFFFGTKLSVLVSTFTAFTFFLSLRVRFESILATVEAQLGRKSALEILSEWLVCVLKNFFCPHWNGPAQLAW